MSLADGPARRDASRPIDHRAVHKLNDACDQQVTVVSRLLTVLDQVYTVTNVVNDRLTTVARLSHPLAVKYRVRDKVPEGSYFIFGITLISLKHSVERVERSLYDKTQLDPYSRFDTIPACDRQTDSHRPTANTRASIASRG